MAGHVERLFSAAYDGGLGAGDMARFDAHLAGCGACARAWDDYRTGLDALHDVPAARMPVPVVLPASPPVVEPSRRRLRMPGLAVLRRPRPAMAAASLALAGVAAVAVAVRFMPHGTSPASRPSAGLSQALPKAAAGAGAGTSFAAGCPPASLQAIAGAAGTSAAAPEGFANRVAVTDPARPGQELVVATQAKEYAAGQTVVVYARLAPTASGAGGGAPPSLPCVSLVGAAPAAQAPAPLERAAGSTSGGCAVGPTVASPLAVAHAATGQTANAGPLLAVTVPAGTASGTTLHLVATVPAGSGCLQAALTIVVR